MNVNNRKLFANRDARRRLSEMGGIVASYPELLGAAQKFQVGGEARFMNPNDRLNTLMSSPYVMQQADMLNMTPQDYVSGLSPARSAQLIEASIANQRDLAAMQETPSPAPTVAEGPVPVLEPDALRFVTGPDFAQPDFPTAEEELANAEALARAEAELAARQATRRAEIAERNAATAEAAGRDDAEELRARADAAAAEAAALTGNVPQREAPVLTADRPVPPVEAAAAETGGTDSTPEDRQLTAEELADVVSGSEDPNADAASVVLSSLGGGEGADLSSVEGRISAYEDLFTRMLGESDEEKRREKYMNLAMVGFAIAAGEDPSALKNIADGLLAGTAQMQESAAARREREDRIKELAISLGFEDYQAAIKAAADAAESDTESFFGTDAGEFASETYSDLIGAGLTHTQAIERMNEANGMGDRLLQAVEAELSPSTPDLTPQQRIRVRQAQQALADQASPEAVAEVLRNEGIDPSVLGL